MSEEKGIGSKLLGLFVERDEDGARSPEAQAQEDAGQVAKTPAEIVAELALASGRRPPASGPTQAKSLPPLQLERAANTPVSAPTDFDVIFRDAGMDLGELDRVKKAEELLRTLPESTPTQVKRQIVEASLKAFGFEIEKIVTAAQNQKRALDAYVKVNENATAKAIQDAEAQIRALNEKIAGLRQDIEKRTQTLATTSTSAQARKLQVQEVLDFFASAPPGMGA